MPRVARVVVPNCPHHIIQRGNNRHDVFFVDDDRRAYLAFLKRSADAFGLSVLGYCLMTNHVHLVAVPRDEDSLAKAVGRAHFAYSQYINRLHGRVGHLWQGRFYSVALDEPHLWSALSYVERNPVRARLVRRAWLHRWSSASFHVGETRRDELLDAGYWRESSRGLDWRKVLVEAQDDDLLKSIRTNTHTGRPLGSDRFVAKLERLIGRRLRPLPVGRPKKKRGK